MMKKIFIIATSFCFLLGIVSLCCGENRGLEQLLELIEKKGVISVEEAKKIRKTIDEDHARLLRKESQLEDKERALIKRERDLKEQEDVFHRKAGFLPEQEKALTAKPSQKIEGISGEDASLPEEGLTVKKETETSFPLEAEYENGFWLKTREPGLFSLRIGGLLQGDYRYYHYENDDPEKNGFDLRRARLLIMGKVYRRFEYKFQYEFQGAGSRHLLDAYAGANVAPFISFRIGQFKEPFGLEQCDSIKNLVFAERSMSYYLTPGRDVGLMAHGSFWEERVDYGLGIFNGDGYDDSVGSDVDSPQLTGRLVFAPFRNRGIPLGEDFQIGGSLGYAQIDRNNVTVNVKTTGLTSVFDVAASGKFNIIRDADKQIRYGGELGWAYGPLALRGEYIYVKYLDVRTSSAQFDFDLKGYYGSILWMVTGEHPTFENGVFQPIKPLKSVWQGGWGALGLAFRYDAFKASESVYNYLVIPGNSIRKATGYSFALNWFLNSSSRLIFDATRTTFDRPLLIYRDSITGTAVYSDHEDVITGRLQFAF